MGRYPCCEGNGLKKGPWTPEEDKKLVQYIQKHGHGCWKAIPKLAGLNRCGKSCRLRWTNYLRPDIKRGTFSKEEEETILNLHSILGNKWSTIATHLPGRTDNEIKNFWNTHLKKKLIQKGFDPTTHRLRPEIFTGLPHLIALANLTDQMGLITWGEQAVRLQEAVQIAKFQYIQCLLQSAASVAGTSSNSFTSNADMEAINNLLDSVPLHKESMAFNNSLLEFATPFSLGITASQPILPDQMPSNNPAEEMKFSNTFQQPKSVEISQSSKFALFSQGDYTQNPPLPPPSPLIENPTTPPGDARTTSSSNGAGHLYWPDQLFPEDPFFY